MLQDPSFGYYANNYSKIFNLSMQYLPKLRNIGNRAQRIILKPAPIRYCLGKLTTKWLLEVHKPRTLALQDITLYKASSIPDGVHLPNLTSLSLLMPSENFLCDQRMSKVYELSITADTKDAFVRILEQLGQQLKKICVDAAFETIPMDQILNLCPNLDMMSYVDRNTLITLESDINPDTLRQLTELDMSWFQYSFGSEALLQLLQAPELRILGLNLCSVDQKEVEEIVRRLQQREILQKLEIANFWDLSTWFENVKLSASQATCLLSNMVLHCPMMVNVTVNGKDLYRRND